MTSLIGVVESHGRRETEALLRGLEVLPRKPIEYKDRALMEFDIDGALARRPKLLIVDEYAHSNATGSRYPKRWQDVEELLGAGIDVWTTLNVQHLESLVDVVLRITGVRQRETVPDSALSRADDIELVDITPDELRTRLADGKVYVPETARLAADNFFKPENLTALRELALRRMAQTVDDQPIATMREKGVEGPWAAGERIVVLVGGDAMASALVRTARRLSDMMMDAPWTVAHVERPNQKPPSPAALGRLSEALKLAEQLGRATVVLTGDDVVASVMSYARRNNVTQIVIGKSRDSRLREMLGRTLATALLRQARGAAVHVVTERGGEDVKSPPFKFQQLSLSGWRGHLGALAFVAVTGALAGLLDQLASGANLAMIFLLSVLGAGLAFGLWPVARGHRGGCDQKQAQTIASGRRDPHRRFRRRDPIQFGRRWESLRDRCGFQGARVVRCSTFAPIGHCQPRYKAERTSKDDGSWLFKDVQVGGDRRGQAPRLRPPP